MAQNNYNNRDNGNNKRGNFGYQNKSKSYAEQCNDLTEVHISGLYPVSFELGGTARNIETYVKESIRDTGISEIEKCMVFPVVNDETQIIEDIGIVVFFCVGNDPATNNIWSRFSNDGKTTRRRGKVSRHQSVDLSGYLNMNRGRGSSNQFEYSAKFKSLLRVWGLQDRNGEFYINHVERKSDKEVASVDLSYKAVLAEGLGCDDENHSNVNFRLSDCYPIFSNGGNKNPNARPIDYALKFIKYFDDSLEASKGKQSNMDYNKARQFAIDEYRRRH